MKMKSRGSSLLAAMFLLLTGTMSSCMSDDYDLSKDVDLTMGLGSEGLALKLINSTDTIYLRDVLKVSSSPLLDTTSHGLYYIHKAGTTNFNIQVNNVSVNMKQVNLSPEVNVYTNNSGRTIPYSSGREVNVNQAITATNDMSTNVINISPTIIRVHTVTLASGTSFRLKMSVVSNTGKSFALKEIKNLRLTFPDYLKVSGASNNVLHLGTISGSSSTVDVGTATITHALFADNNPLGRLIGDDHALNLSGSVTMLADGVTFRALNGGTFAAGEGLSVRLTIEQLNGISVTQMTGVVNPEINPQINPISIYSELPDFMKNDSVRIYPENPSMYVYTSGDTPPIPLKMTANIDAWKNNARTAQVKIPATGNVDIKDHVQSNFYFCGSTTPFDATGVKSSAPVYQVSSFGSLFNVLPDLLDVDMKNGKIVADQTVLHTINPGTDYNSNVNYDFYVPFVFNAKTRIVYDDSITNMNKDLKDYKADGLLITADVMNEMPSNLVLNITPYDVNGNEIKSITITPAQIKEAKVDANQVTTPVVTPISVDMSVSQPEDVQKIEKLVFHIYSSVDNTEQPSYFLSSQKLILNNMRLKLKGKVITNFN